MSKILPIGTKVKVIKNAHNASQFTLNNSNIPINGIYSIKQWDNKIFEIAGEPKLCKFEHDPNIFGAYPLNFNGKLIGYVYNTALETVESELENNTIIINITINITYK